MDPLESRPGGLRKALTINYLFNLQATAYAADPPFRNGPYKSRGVAGAAEPKTWIFDVLGLGRHPGTLEGQNYMF